MINNKGLKKIYIVVLLIILFAATILIVFYFKNKIIFKEINNDIYYLKYDNTWKLKSDKDSQIVLENNESMLTLKINEFKKGRKYEDIDSLFDEFIHSTKDYNTSYKLLTSEKDKITKNMVDCYKLLYENDEKQLMIWLYIEADKYIVASYESPNKYFDILLGSVNNIIHNFTIKEERYDLTSELNIKLSKVEYGNDKKFDIMLNDVKSYEIANNNYIVNYSIPVIFKMDSLDSNVGHFTTDDLSKNISVQIVKNNIYEEINRTYEKMGYYKKNEDGLYKDYKESLSKFNSDYDSYIYKVNYTYTDLSNSTNSSNRRDEKVNIFYALNNNHTLVIEFESLGSSITKKMIDMVKINGVTNYASNIKIVKSDGYLIGELKRFANPERTKVEVITLKVSEKFEEIDKRDESINSYLQKFYGYNYDEHLLIYDYEVEYNLEKDLSSEEFVNSYNMLYYKTTYGKANKVVSHGKVTLNNKEFEIYSGGYTDISGILFTDNNRKKYYKNVTILSYKMPTDGYLYITIQGNDKEIKKEMLKELTNFTIEERNY